MKVTTATGAVEELGPLSRLVFQYGDMIARRATAEGAACADWAPLAELVDIENFKRVGAYLEEMSWDDYVRFLTQWAGSTRFEATIFHVSEIGRRVFQEIEERHYRGDETVVKNVIAVFEFDDRDKIRHLDIYEQARDTGQWIVEAARAATR